MLGSISAWSSYRSAPSMSRTFRHKLNQLKKLRDIKYGTQPGLTSVREARTSLAEKVERVLGVAAGDRRMR